jgi:peptidoglycan/LPS O-acetylase OafA/YrhL
MQVLPYFIYTVIVAGIFFKFASYYFTNSQDTFSGTHNRIDGLAWGVLLALQISQKKIPKKSLGTFSIGLILLIISVTLSYEWSYFEKVLYHSFIPLSFYLMLKGVYYLDFSGLKGMRLLAYYSYNIFLWHDLISIFVLNYWGNNLLFLLLYMIISILIGVILTIAIEEPFLKVRNWLIKKCFYKEKKTT